MSEAEVSPPEFSRFVDLREIGNHPVALSATAKECTALARRFELVRVDSLAADVMLERQGAEVTAQGQLRAFVVQSCAVSGEDLPVAIAEPLALRFVPQATRHSPDEEVELTAEDCDEIEYSGTRFDLGEAVAQSLGLAIDPFAVGPAAEEARRQAGLLDESASGPFAALAALKKAD